ncbi:outward-rectifier potassium channel [Naegleria gruberi]|uniref:Outward-rectifier potassium channel n=1 Tax=Naegleria gruberi TaxID=5762 RepID=D2V059_NAEGR|nr:outward-rectifier potassium channel [Naegleria gruberi]EFC49658.1 outward-rectifier potassium channel [Naegleria gruberi]|eukprot:XP_002682402.1 outward-rectifier potassium channel [Naegleria gruberi strain NEG-M]
MASPSSLKSVSWDVIHQLFGNSTSSGNIENMIQHYVELYFGDDAERRKLRICDRLFEFIDGYSEFVMFMNGVEHEQRVSELALAELDQDVMDNEQDVQFTGEIGHNDEKQGEFPQVSQEHLMGEHVIVDLVNSGTVSNEEEAPTLDNTQSELDSDADEVKEKKFMKLLNGFSDKLMGDISKEYIQKPSLKDFAKDILKLLISFALIMAVIALGAMAVMFIEQDVEYKNYLAYKENLLNSTLDEYSFDNSTGNANVTIDPFNPKWTYGNSVYFMIVTLSTIGYGDMSPTTIGGKLWVVFFGFLGISLMGMWISFVGGAIMNSFGTGIFVVMLYIKRSIVITFKTAKNRDLEEVMRIKANMKNPELTPLEKKMFSFFNRGATQIINMILLLGGYVVGAAALFSYLENWEFYDAFYYSFVTLSTIGYGDFYPKTTNGKITFGFFVLIGLGLLGILLGFVAKSIQESLLSNFKKAQKKTFLEFKDLQEKAAMKQIGNMMNKQKQNMTQGFNILKKGGKGGIHLMRAGGVGGLNKLKQGGNLLKEGGVGGLNKLKQGGKGGMNLMKAGGAGGLNKLKQGGNLLKEGGVGGLNKLKQGGNLLKEGGTKLKNVTTKKKENSSSPSTPSEE